MLGGAGGAASAPGEGEIVTVTIVKDEQGYGMKVSGDKPVYVQSVKEHGAAWRAGLRSGDRIHCVDGVPVLEHTHQQVVHMIKANLTTCVLTVQQNASRHKTPITAPLPVNPEKQRQLEMAKAHTVRQMLEKEQKYIRDLRNELSKVPDVRKQVQLESAEQRCSILQNEIDNIISAQPETLTPRLASRTKMADKTSPPPNTGFLSAIPRSLSNLTGQSLRNLRQSRMNSKPQDIQPLVRQNSDDNTRRRHVHNNTVPMVPTTCLDNVTPPPLPPRSIERPKRTTLSPPNINPLAKPKPCTSATPIQPMHSQYARRYPDFPMHQSVPSYSDNANKLRRSAHSLDGELDGPQPNSIALQMSYPLVNAPPPPLQTDNRGNVPVLHVRSQSSPEHLDHELPRTGLLSEKEAWERGTPPPGTPPPPYANNTQPCADPQRAIISMEEDDSPASDNSTYSGLFSNLRSVRESKVKTAVLLNWLLGERRCACANLLLIITDGYRSATGVPLPTLRRWAYEIQSTFLMPNAVLQLNGVDENMANEIEHVLVNEYEKEELLRNVFRKARQKAKEELAQQLSEFQVKRQVGLGTLYGPADQVIAKCHADKQQEQTIVERIMCERLRAIANTPTSTTEANNVGNVGKTVGRACPDLSSPEAHQALLAALIAAALCLLSRPAAVAAAVGGQRAAFLQRDKLYKQRTKQLAKNHPQPFVVRGHHLQLQALTSVGHCHHCDNVIWGLAPQAYVCAECKLRVHRSCARGVEEGCLGDYEHSTNRISRFMERIHHQPNSQDANDKKSRKASAASHFLNMERSIRKIEDEPPWDQTLTPASLQERRDESDESLYESADCHSDAVSASEDAIPRLGKTPTMSKESLKIAITDEEVDPVKIISKKGHRKTMSLSNPLEMVKTLGDEWFDHKKEIERNADKRKSKESIWSEEDRESINCSTVKPEQERKNSKKDKSQSENKKNIADPKSRKTSKGSSVSSFNFLRRKKTPTSLKTVESVAEVVDKVITIEELLNFTRLFLEEEKRHCSVRDFKPPVETDTEDDMPSPKLLGEQRRRLSRQTSRSKSKVRGKSQSVKVNTLRKSHSGTLKKGKKKMSKTPSVRSRQASLIDQTPLLKKKNSDCSKQNSWLFSGPKGEARREGSTEDTTADADPDAGDVTPKDNSEKDNSIRGTSASGRGVNRAESCRERDAPRRGKHRNASDPNRLTAAAHNHHDLEPGAATAPSGSSSSSSLSSRSNESNTVPAEQQASQSDWSDEDEPLAAQWADSLPPRALDSLTLNARLRKRQEVIHELIVSEGSHVRWLRVLGSVFLRPLEASGLLAADELRALLPNLPQVRERHAKLYADLKALRSDPEKHVVPIGPVADALLNTLGESSYAATLSRFCRGQRMALDALKERRRKNKELHQFLASREQLPLCGRLQLRDLVACVWQRLTKYQLLLESILKTVNEGDDEDEKDSPEDIDRVKRALHVAKEVLHSVDTAIRTAENEHRLRTIQSKLEVRISCSGSEWDEARRLDLTTKALRMEGELSIRNDSNKKMSVLALMLEDALVLLQREGERFVLRPITPPSQQTLLSPLIKWEKVLFRPNAAVRHTFFLMNINGVQMHELSASSANEYALWVRHMSSLPLAKPELRPALTPHHAPQRSHDDSGINVSRNPSDASEKSTSSVPDDESERDRASVDRASEKDRASIDREEREKRIEKSVEREEERRSVEKEEQEKEEKHRPRRPTVGRITTHTAAAASPLVDARAVNVAEPANHSAHIASTELTQQERLRRLEHGISRALQAKTAIVAELLGIPKDGFTEMADIAVAETLGQVDVCSELLNCSGSAASPVVSPDLHQLLLAAQAQVNLLTETLSRALTVSEAACVAKRASGNCGNLVGNAVGNSGNTGRCGNCRRRVESQKDAALADDESVDRSSKPLDSSSDKSQDVSADKDWSYDMLPDLDNTVEHEVDDVLGAAELATRLSAPVSTLSSALSLVLSALPQLQNDAQRRRTEIAQLREDNDRLRARLGYPASEEISFTKEDMDPASIPDQPSNGG